MKENQSASAASPPEADAARLAPAPAGALDLLLRQFRRSEGGLILAILVAYFYLHTFWKQLVLVIAGLFIMILKNGVRIVTLTLLASYVDPGFLYGRLHREGGVVFFVLGLLLLTPLLWALQRSERAPTQTAS